MKQHYSLSLLFCALFLAQLPSIAQHQVELANGTFPLEALSSKAITSSNISSWPVLNGQRMGIISFAQLPDQSQQKALAEAGVSIIEFLNGSSYLVAIQPGATISLVNALGVNAIRPWTADMKFLDGPQVPSFARSKGNRVMVNLHYFSGHSGTVQATLPEGVNILDHRATYSFITVEVDQNNIDALATLPAVKSIDWKYDYGAPENYTSRQGHRINYLSPESDNGLEYTGEGINVMLQDDGFIGPHVDFHGRIGAQYWTGNLGDHGDHVGGTIAGAGNINPYTEGQAPGSDLYVYKAAPEYQGFDSIDIHYNSLDVVITSTSYSNGCNAGYTALAREMDDQVQNYEHLMHVFSAGNSNGNNCGYGAGTQWGNITGGHKIGKNVIAVANLDDIDQVSGSSSRGPASDGRIKPDVATKGSSVYSTTDPNDYTFKSGTSMSCPGVSGALAVLYEAYEDLNGDLPPAGLGKAAMMNTCHDLGPAGPDFIYGWGRVNVRKAYETFENNYIITGSISNMDSAFHTINVPANSSQLRVMVYWTDPEASVSAATHLVNDIDMSMEDPNGGQHIRWTPNPAPNAATLDDDAAPGPDHLNNVEQIVIDNPTNGNYQVRLDGYNIPMGPQEYFIVYWFEPKEIVVTYPNGGEHFNPFVDELVRWDAPAEGGTFTVEYTLDGTNWVTANSNINGAQTYYDWNVPNTISSTAQVRVTNNQSGLVGVSSPFDILRVPSGLSIEYSCPDSIGLQWSNMIEADTFDIHLLGNKYMEYIGSSTTTEFVDYNSNPNSDLLWYSISARNANGAESKRATAIYKAPGISNCIVPNDIGLNNTIPEGGALYSCHEIDGGYSLGISVINSGTTPISSFDASLSTTGGQTFSETFTGTIAPGASADFTFATLLNSPAGQEEVTVVVSMLNDGNEYNDTVVTVFEEVNEPTETLQWRENFETFTSCSTESTCGLVVCPLNDGWFNEPNGLTDDIDFRTHSGSTPSDQTGPNIDHNPGTTTGKYLYLEASGDCVFQTALLTSPCIDLVGLETATLTFWYHMDGAEMGTLSLDLFDGQQWILDIMPQLSGSQGSSWNDAVVDLTPYVGNIVNFRFRGTTGSTFRSDMAIDDISVLAPPVANFSYTITQPVDVNYTDLSLLADTMSFDLGDGTVMDSVPGTYVYGQAGTYIVQQIVSNEVGADTAVQLIAGLSVNDLSGHGLRLFPNPAGDFITLEQESGRIEEITIYDASGRVAEQFMTNGALTQRYDVSSLKPGLYMVRLKGETEVTTPLSIVR